MIHCTLQKHPVIHAQGLRQLPGGFLADSALAVLHFADVTLRNTGIVRKLALCQSFAVPGAGEVGAGFVLLQARGRFLSKKSLCQHYPA